MGVSTDPLQLSVSDVKQYIYCPRVVYFTYLMPGLRYATYKMQEGKLQHEDVQELEERRSLKAYELIEGERKFGVYLHSARLGLSGKLDMAIVTESEVIPVDFKNSSMGLELNHKYQLAAYALLAEEAWLKPVRRGFIYLIPLKKAESVTITPNMRAFVLKLLSQIREMVAKESMPPVTRQKVRCRDCEFHNFCNEV